jgi:hypothetical protein
LVTSITIVRNPAGDADFERAIGDIVSAGVREPADAQSRLRERYPRAVVRARALSGESTPIWYVYREGRWIADD